MTELAKVPSAKPTASVPKQEEKKTCRQKYNHTLAVYTCAKALDPHAYIIYYSRFVIVNES